MDPSVTLPDGDNLEDPRHRCSLKVGVNREEVGRRPARVPHQHAFERGGYAEYTLAFDVSTGRPRAVRYEMKTWFADGPEDAEPELGVLLTESVTTWANVGDLSVPQTIEQRANGQGPFRNTQGRRGATLALSNLQLLDPSAASKRIASGLDPLMGEHVCLTDRGLEFNLGDTRFELAGVTFKAPDPLLTIPKPEDMMDLVRRSKRIDESAPASEEHR